ncbi:MAG: tetratricopeptide repeat protein [Bacteroidetes bacterium]|nr:tetratricopeptide repeat protein [Bacteroidota bacterium]
MHRILKYSLSAFFCIGLLFSVCAQQSQADSLKRILNAAKNDTTRCTILIRLIESENDALVWEPYNIQLQTIAEKNIKKYPAGNPLHKLFLKYQAGAINNTGFLEAQTGQIKSALAHFEKSLEIYEQIEDKIAVAECLNNLGVIYYQLGNIPKALEYYKKSLSIDEEMGVKSRIATTCNNLGSIYEFTGDIPKALAHFSRSLKIGEEIKDINVIATALNNLALVYQKQGQHEKALEYYSKSLNNYEAAGDKNGISTSLGNIGLIYNQKGQSVKALNYYEKALKIQEQLGNKAGMCISFNNIGRIYFKNYEYEKAMEFYNKCMRLQEELQDKSGMAVTLNNIGAIFAEKKDYQKAISYFRRSLEISKELGFPEHIQHASNLLSQMYKKTGMFREAFINYELSIIMRDSINNAQNRKASVKNQLKYEYEKRAAADSVKNAEEQKIKNALLAAQKAQIKQEQFKRYGLFGGLLIVMAGLGFVINRFRVAEKQKKIIELQKIRVDHAYEKLAEKNKEVLDSIRYAKRIQTALVTSEKYINKSLNRLMK